jgi:hypothetical protein
MLRDVAYGRRDKSRSTEIKNALRHRRAFGLQGDMKNYNKFFIYSCLTKTCPDPTTEVVDMGLRLALASKQKIEVANIGRYFTTHEEYVNAFDGTHLHEKDSPYDYPYG